MLDSPWYEGKLRWFDRLARWLAESARPDEAIVLGGDLNVTPSDDDVWDAGRAHGSTHVSARERDALARLREWGLRDLYRIRQPATDRYSWYDYRAGMFHRNEGMRIDLLYGSPPVADRVVWAEIDREARKGPPTPSDHAPVVVDLDEPGQPIEAGWQEALERIQRRSRPR
jgi:exodeoxyribonuclease-3